MKKILILSLILATSCLSQVYAETEVYNKIELTQKDAAKKIIGTWKVSDLSKSSLPVADEKMKKIIDEMEYIFTGSEFTIKIMGKEQKLTYTIKNLKKDILTITLTNKDRTKDEKIRLTKEGITLIEKNGSELSMKKVENKTLEGKL